MEAALDLVCSQLRSELQYLTGGEVRIVCCCSGKVWDIAGGAGKVTDHIFQYERHDGPNQRWLLVPVNMGMRLFEIQSPFCGLVAGLCETDTSSEKHLEVNQRSGDGNQRFVFEKTQVDGEYFIRAWHSNLVLDIWQKSKANGVKIAQHVRHGGANQRFRVERINSR